MWAARTKYGPPGGPETTEMDSAQSGGWESASGRWHSQLPARAGPQVARLSLHPCERGRGQRENSTLVILTRAWIPFTEAPPRPHQTHLPSKAPGPNAVTGRGRASTRAGWGHVQLITAGGPPWSTLRVLTDMAGHSGLGHKPGRYGKSHVGKSSLPPALPLPGLHSDLRYGDERFISSLPSAGDFLGRSFSTAVKDTDNQTLNHPLKSNAGKCL